MANIIALIFWVFLGLSGSCDKPLHGTSCLNIKLQYAEVISTLAGTPHTPSAQATADVTSGTIAVSYQGSAVPDLFTFSNPTGSELIN